MTAAAVLAVARSQLGTRESPRGSNRTPYGAVYGLDGQPWCQIFIWWCFQRADLGALVPKGAYTPTIARWYRDRGQWGSAPRPGALAYMRFPGLDRISHVGIVETIPGDGSVITIEGNTRAPGVSGSQRDGDGVWRRRRRAYIAGYAYPAYAPDPPPAHPATGAAGARPVLRRGHLGAEVEQLQRTLATWYPWLHLAVDGRFGPATAAAVQTLQQRAGLPITGDVDAATWAALGYRST